MGQQLTKIKDLTTAAEGLSKEYKNVYDQAVKATKAIYDFMQAEQNRAAAAAEEEARKKAEEDAKKKRAAQPKPGVHFDSKIGSISSDNYAGLLSKELGNSKNRSSATKAISVDEVLASGSGALDGTSRNLAMGIAGSILLSNKDNWGNGQTRLNNLIKVFGEQLGSSLNEHVSSQIQRMANNAEYRNSILNNYEWYKSFDMKNFKQKSSFYLKNASKWSNAFDTGGYTGDWNSSEGRVAILHEKELILNKQDTKNILDSVTIMRSIMASMSGNIISKLGSLTSVNPTTSSFGGNSSMLQQQVKIQATFPNVNSKKEIEEALSDLVNLAAQRAMR